MFSSFFIRTADIPHRNRTHRGRIQVQEWLRQSEYRKLAGLVTKLRIEEAQRVLVEHRDWSVESVADYCGFNDRKYFHQVFQQYTGTTPAKYQQANN